MTVKKSRSTAQTPSLTSTLSELEVLLKEIESEEMSIEDALAAFERGMALTRTAQKMLNEAEQRVHMLLNAKDDPDGNG